MNGLLIRVGIDSSKKSGGWIAPRREDGRFCYVPIRERFENRPSRGKQFEKFYKEFKPYVKDLKDNYIRPNGLTLIIDEFRPSRWQGSKEERILSTLEPRYANHQIWHYAGGNCQSLEEELVFTNPPHDDIKDALASAIDFAKPPIDLFNMHKVKEPFYDYHGKYGGVA